MTEPKTTTLESGTEFTFSTKETERGTELTQRVFQELLWTRTENSTWLLSKGQTTESFLKTLKR